MNRDDLSKEDLAFLEAYGMRAELLVIDDPPPVVIGEPVGVFDARAAQEAAMAAAAMIGTSRR